MLSRQRQPSVMVRTSQGILAITPTIVSNRYDMARVPDCIRPFLEIARAVTGAIPASSASGIMAALRAFRAFVSWSGQDPSTTDPSPEWLVAFIVARCAPPVETTLPNDPVFRRPVLPPTAVGDVDELRRGLRLGIEDLDRWESALSHPSVIAFSKEIGGRVGRLKTNKRPFLFNRVEEAWSRWGPEGTGKGSDRKSLTHLRDACSIVLGFFYGCRASEISNILLGDITIAGDKVRLKFKSRKNRRSLLGLHQPQTITASHPLLLNAMQIWTTRIRSLGATDATPLFPRTEGNGTADLRNAPPMSPASIRFRCKEIDPLCVAHSLRAGMATEAWAAGVPVEAIMALGGWTSPVAVMYIVGASDETVSASLRLGTAKMRYEGADLRASLGTARLSRHTWAME